MVMAQLYQVSGAQGINLHDCCSTVILSTPGYNLATEEQAVHRTIRIAQKETVRVYYLHLENSHDDWKIIRQFYKMRLNMGEVDAMHASLLGEYLKKYPKHIRFLNK
ncbi:hypothetical protein PG996_002998 [Apiospora saccharicola]|uniref:Helicase C-terminal domain-containing protein n=1 Tax=Apiospora saccharicola TaxID=335842 RepID=A0ABR1W042_9PEZI